MHYVLINSLLLLLASAQPPSTRSQGMETQHNKTAQNKVSLKTTTKENTRPQEIKLHTEQRAVKRAMFNYTVAMKLYIEEQQRKQTERLVKMIEEEEVRALRKEMVPRAQLMPLFDKPFFPQRSKRPLTVPREPSFLMLNNKSCSCDCDSCCELPNFPRSQAMKPT